MNISSCMNVTSATQWSTFTHFLNSSVARWSGIILATTTTAVIGLGIYRWNQIQSDQQDNAIQDDRFDQVKARVCRVYSYVFGGWTLTAAAAAAAHISGLSIKILQNSYLSIPLCLGSCAALAAILLINKEKEKAKNAAWFIFNATMGMMLSPLGFLDQRIVAQAAAISVGLGGTLTLSAFLAPDRRFLSWEGPLMATLTTLSCASLVACFFPRTAFAYGVDRASLYGGLVVFSGLLMCSTQRLMEEAEKQNDAVFDPISSSMNIYLDGLNLFIRILRVMLEKEEKA
jgi:FtsH-binding integral membrane protein